MTIARITKKDKTLKGIIRLPSSKSESNRVLIIRALCKKKFEIKNLSTAEDTQILQKILTTKTRNPDLRYGTGQKRETNFNVGAAGTTMRFLTAFFSMQEGSTITLTGSQRMKDRPIKILTEALVKLGADIQYPEKPGFPPLKITGKNLRGGKITVDGSISSQYISALLMIAPAMKEGLTIEFPGEIVSLPYINMTLKIMNHFGIEHTKGTNTISIKPQVYQPKNFAIESDWSAASYWYEMAAFAEEVDLTLTGLEKQSLQGDSVVAKMFESFGVKTTFLNGTVHLEKSSGFQQGKDEMGIVDFSSCPDLAQTFAVTCAGLGISAQLTGLKTLRIKETDRISALHSELLKAGLKTEIFIDDLHIEKSQILPAARQVSNPDSPISTYQDHRMAMSFAPLAMVSPEIIIENPEVVNKSYPGFWEDLQRAGFKISNK